MSFDKVDPTNRDEEVKPESDYDADEFDEDTLTVKRKKQKCMPKIITMRDFEMRQMFGNP